LNESRVISAMPGCLLQSSHQVEIGNGFANHGPALA
jgi:hypothetical protein